MLFIAADSIGVLDVTHDGKQAELAADVYTVYQTLWGLNPPNVTFTEIGLNDGPILYVRAASDDMTLNTVLLRVSARVWQKASPSTLITLLERYNPSGGDWIMLNICLKGGDYSDDIVRGLETKNVVHMLAIGHHTLYDGTGDFFIIKDDVTRTIGMAVFQPEEQHFHVVLASQTFS